MDNYNYGDDNDDGHEDDDGDDVYDDDDDDDDDDGNTSIQNVNVNLFVCQSLARSHVRQAKFCLRVIMWFFSEISRFRTSLSLTRLKVREIILTGRKTQITICFCDKRLYSFVSSKLKKQYVFNTQ